MGPLPTCKNHRACGRPERAALGAAGPGRLLRSGAVWALAVAALGGCQAWQATPGMPGAPPPLQNPLLVPAVDREFLWSQLVDTVDDYFKIQREERVRQVGEVVLEGRIETLPQDGATLLEPWRKDSTPGFEKYHSTLQTIRRRATVRVLPAENGYLVEVIVIKEQEDLLVSPSASAGQAAMRNEGSVDHGTEHRGPGRPAAIWIPLGRDVSLEQQMLAEIRARLTS
jgi:hypothetical protein